jgi:parvulin-like peptidyl-prolyl isomerase
MKSSEMKMTKLSLALALGVALFAPALRAATETAFGAVLARAKGAEVRRSELDDAFIAYRANLAARGQNIPEARREVAEAQLLDRILVTRLLVAQATETDKENAKTNINKFLSDSRKMVNTDADFARHLRSLGMTMAQFTNRVVEQAFSEEVITREVKSKIVISETDMQKFWETNDAAFRQPELARASHILFATRDLATNTELNSEEKKKKKERADSVLLRARGGEDFTNLVARFSEDPGAKENRGEYKFARAKDDPRRAMVPEFEAAAFGLKTNQISEVITTDHGYHIIKLHEITPARKVPFEEARERIKDFLTQQALEKQMPSFFAKMKKDAGVEILDDKLKAALEKAEKERAAN